MPSHALHVDGEAGGGVDDGAGADEQHAIALPRLVGALIEGVARYRLAEHHGVPLDDAAALRALRRQLLDRELLQRPAGGAGDATQLRAVAVDLGYGDAAGLLVQVIDV